MCATSKMIWIIIIVILFIECSSERKSLYHNPRDVPVDTLYSFDLSNVSNLTMSSVLFNPTSHLSDWIDRIFGSKAIFYRKTSMDGILEKSDVSTEEVHDRSESFKSKFTLPNYAVWPSCSVELLGFVQETDFGPFNEKIRKELYIGKARLMIKKRSIMWKCYYRVVFENWREDMEHSRPNYWAVLFYCPGTNIQQCKELDRSLRNENLPENIANKPKSEEGVIIMQTPHSGTKWTASFSSRPFVGKYGQYSHNFTAENGFSSFRNPTSDRMLQMGMSSTKAKNIPMAVCLSIPYTSSDPGKTEGNGAMLLEWIRYYTVLGFKVLIYDRDGANKQHIYNSKYGVSQRIRIPNGRLIYHPYTIRGLLDPSRKGLKHDNTDTLPKDSKEAEDIRMGRYQSQGHDKVQTLTHCRFEARALYGIKNVLIVDFDEFLFCPVAPSTLRGQSSYINQFFTHMKSIGMDQVEFTQRVVGNKTESPRDCVVDQATKGKSIFDCFGSYLFYNGAHSTKCMHLGHSCPLTGYHNACPTDDIPRSHDCLCTSITVKSNNWKPYEHRKGRECAVVHLSTNIGSYGRPAYEFTPDEQEQVFASTLEMSLVVKGTHGSRRKRSKDFMLFNNTVAITK